MPNKDTIAGIVEFASRLGDINVKVLQEGLEISRLHCQIERIFTQDYWMRWGLSPVQIRIMLMLFYSTDSTITPAMLSEEVMLTRSATTSALDSLEKPGYTIRKPHPRDRRKIVIRLTPAGRKFISERAPELLRRIQRIMGHLTQKERDFLLRAHRKMLDLLIFEKAEGNK